MAALPGDDDVELIRRRQQRATADRECADGMAGHIVQPVDLVDRPTLHQAFLDHDVATAAALFSGLEDKHRPPVEIARFCQILRGPQQDRGVPVMAAGMHLARRFGRILKPRRLGDG